MPQKTDISIGSLTPERKSWRILGQCTAKGDLLETATKTLVFAFDLTDEREDTIRVTAYGEYATLLFPKVKVATDYYLSECSIKNSNKKYNTTGHEYELTVCGENSIKVSATKIKFPPLRQGVPLNRLYEHQQVSKQVDALAFIQEVHLLQKDPIKRYVQLTDNNGTIVTLLLWNGQAQLINQNDKGKRIGIKGATVWIHEGQLFINGGRRLELIHAPQQPMINKATYNRTITPVSEHKRENHPKMLSELNLNVVSLDRVAGHAGNMNMIDVFALIDGNGEMHEFTNRKGIKCARRDVQLIDQTGTIVKFVLWGESAKGFQAAKGCTIAIANAQVQDYKGVLQLTGGTWTLNPQGHLADDLTKWYSNNRNNLTPENRGFVGDFWRIVERAVPIVIRSIGDYLR